MADSTTYAILGRGRWAGRMGTVLAMENRGVASLAETRQLSSENDTAYRSRLAHSMKRSGARIAWLCVPPGPHVPHMIVAALDAGLHIVVEKPWYGSQSVTDSLRKRATALRRVIAIHFEYCVLSEIEKWRNELGGVSGLQFGGRFFLSRPDHMGVPALDNLGSHLLAIRAYAVPHSTVREIRCGYQQPDERSVWLEKNGSRLAFINLLETKERIIQRYIAQLEESLEKGQFPFDLDFGLRVAKDTAKLQ
jgi:predicted dehydrogenase